MHNTSKYRPRYDSRGIALRTGEWQRKSGRYEYQYKDAAGIWHKVSAATLDTLREKEKEIDRDVADGIAVKKKSVTLDKYYAVWKSTKAGIRDNVKSNYIDMYETHIRPTLGKRAIKTIKTSDVKSLYVSMLKKGYSIGTIDNVHTVLHQILQLAYEDDVLRRNPSDKCMKEIKNSAPSATPGRKRIALTPEQQERFRTALTEYDAQHDSNWYPLFVFAMTTGLRLGEFTALQWSDIDWNARAVTVSKTLVYYPDRSTGKQVLTVHPAPKTKQGIRTVPLTNLAYEAISLQYDRTRKSGRQCAVTVDHYDDFIFLNRFNAPYTQGNLNKVLRERILPEANDKAVKDRLVVIPPISCHSLRHTCCSVLCRAGLNVKTIQMLMGHKDIRTTLDLYTEFTGKDLQDGIAQVDDYMDAYLTSH